jgi:PAS domain S-box-containing protein
MRSSTSAPLKPNRRPGRLLPFAIGLFGFCLSCLIGLHLRNIDERALSIESSATARAAARAIEAGLEARYQALLRNAANWSYRGGVPEGEWKLDMERLVHDSPGVLAIALVGNDGVVERLYPEDGSATIIGYDIDLEPERHFALNEARATKRLAISRLIKTYKGGANGFISIAPLFRSARPDGFLVAVFELRGVVPSLTHTPGHRLAIYDAGDTLLYQQVVDDEWAPKWRARAPLRTGNNAWYIEIIPSVSSVNALRTNTPLAGFIIGLVFSVFLAALVREALARRQAELRVRRDLEERLAAERKFQVVFENSSDAQFLVDGEIIIDCNPSTVRILGAKTKAEVIGCHPARFSPPTQPDGSASVAQTGLIAQEIREKGTSRFEWTHCRLDGSTFRAEVTVISLQLEGKDVQLVSWHDLSERFAAEEKFRLLFQHSNDAHLLISDRGILECNPATLALYRAERLENLVDNKPLPPDMSEKPAFIRLERRERRLDGSEFPASITLKRVSYRAEVAYLVTVQDLTEQKNTQAQLMEASKMSSLGEMASGMAHELNTPLAVIKAKGELLATQAAVKQVPSEDLIRHLEVIDKMVNRMATIIRSLRFFARDSARDTVSAASAASIIEETLTLCRSRFAENGIELTVTGDASAELHCRPVQISQILLNLIGNAFDAVNTQERKAVSIAVSADTSLVRLSVEDTGPGIPEELRGKIMQPFFTTKAVGKGTGLGLSISTGLAVSNGGRLYLDASSPRTRFVLEVPLARIAHKQAS